MSDLGLFLTFARELTMFNTQARGRGPSSALDINTIRNALREGGSASGRYAAGYVYHSARITQTIYGAELCIDLGGAPGCQLLEVAKLLPETQFIGVDRSVELIEDGSAAAAAAKLDNVSWINDDICTLGQFEDDSVDAVISTMTLHDLPDSDALNHCLETVARVLRPDGAVYIEDYGRLKAAKSIAYFNSVNGESIQDAFSDLNASSLHAAFTIQELKQAFAAHLPSTHLYSTYLIPFLNVAKTPDRALPPDLVAKLQALREQLPAKKRADLDDLRKFFRLGGWRNDPF